MTRPILNIADVELHALPTYTAKGPTAERFDLRMGEVAPRIGAQKLGYNLTAIPPGKRAFPFHNHRVGHTFYNGNLYSNHLVYFCVIPYPFSCPARPSRGEDALPLPPASLQ